MERRPLGFYEFFAGGGMARAGLGDGWRCLFANDFDPKKAAAYRENWGGDALVCADVAGLSVEQLPGAPDLIWASFPCQDLSLAGDYRGLGRPGANQATRSGAFWPFWRLIERLVAERRGPAVLVLENVLGILTSNGGCDFGAVADALTECSFRFGALVIDARHFVPQSRPRVFVVGVRGDLELSPTLVRREPDETWSPLTLRVAFERLGAGARRQWLWWSLPAPAISPPPMSRFIEDDPADVPWHSREETQALLGMMSSVNRAKVEAATRSGRRMVGTLYRRTRPAPGGGMHVRAEVRFDDIAGCLRTPAGGSSRQKILVVEGQRIRSRLMSGREAARLMGLPDSYRLPSRYSDAYHLAGDGVVVPVVSHLARHVVEPVAAAERVLAPAA
ncbi:MAG TPA: DNA cytosine methyltransferase [Caulobacteraceae bacterium]|nr:DNA cytosine methyltransferase [Caulobacteraceae bacterium]